MTLSNRRAVHVDMVRFADGDREAFRAVFDGLWPILLAFSSRMLAERADAEDAAQRALLKVFSQIADLDRSRDGVAWALTIVAYEIMTTRRMVSRRREQASDQLALVPQDRALPDEEVERAQIAVAMRSMLGEMSVHDQEVIVAVVEGGTFSGETARKRRYRAIERFRALWSRTYG